ncbi:MCE family protein (plasmid) [Mycolicibacterium psychrotolerans]|uniref:MCE family protein n=1 Tax=Mycolicibacterium psychrotolerans TaxID=216929 RepID=UPI003D66559B
MRPFSERNLTLIGAVGVVVVGALVLAALQYKKLPIFTAQKENYAAYFAESSGINTGAHVQVSGLQVGEVTGVELDGARVLIQFTVDKNVALGDRTEAAVKAKSLLGAKILEITPRGDRPLSGPIPLERTAPAYQLSDALGDLSNTVQPLDTDRLNDSLNTIAETFKDTPPDLKVALDGVARFSQTLNERDNDLRNLLANASRVTGVLAKRSDEVVDLVVKSNALLAEMRTQSSALDHISGSISALSKQLSGFVADNRAQLHSALDKLNGVLTIIDNRKQRVQKAITLLNSYAMSLGESLAAGPFFKSYVVNLLPGQFIQPYVDAAFSDLGLDPNTVLPSKRNDPQLGQPGTPALPVPYPRTGQGGEPNMTLPEAITGNSGDPRYPYREPLPAPPPGGPPPGPAAVAPPGIASTPEATPSPVYVTSPNEASSAETGRSTAGGQP